MKTVVKTLSGLALTLAAAFTASAMPITQQLNVTVITVGGDIGANCAAQGPAGNLFFEAETDKIWAQAGKDIHFIFSSTLNNAVLRTGGTGADSFSSALSGPGTTRYLGRTAWPAPVVLCSAGRPWMPGDLSSTGAMG